MTLEERMAELGVDLSDLPQSDGCHLTYDRQSRSMAEQEMYRFAGMSGQLVDIIDCLKMHQDYILHLTDIIDRMETRLDNQTTLLKNLLHVIANADIPEGVTYEQFCLVVDSIYKTVQFAQEGWETYEAGIPKEGSVWEGESDDA